MSIKDYITQNPNYALERVDMEIIDEALKSFGLERMHHSNVITL